MILHLFVLPVARYTINKIPSEKLDEIMQRNRDNAIGLIQKKD